jgi:DNA-binding transcriptional LysR family regulator
MAITTDSEDAHGRVTHPGLGEVASAAGRRWLGVEFRHLGALAAVAREGSFRRAAESLGYVQSAISGQIAHLERAVGTQLVERSSGSAGATLTPAGEVLLGHVEEILARFEAARVDVRAMAEGAQPLVRVAVADGVGARRLPPILREFAGQIPTAEVVIDETHTDEANLESLARGELDLVITELPLPEGPFEHSLLERDPYVLLTGSSSLIAERRARIGTEDITRLRLLVPAPTREADTLLTHLRSRGIDQPPWLRPHDTASVQALVGAGLGAGIVPHLAVDPEDQATVEIPLTGLLPDRLIVLVRHREREYSPTVHTFIEIVERLFAEGPASA